MFKFTTTTLVNSKSYTDGTPEWFYTTGGNIKYADATTGTTTNTTEKSFTVSHNQKFFDDVVTSVSVAPYKAAVKESAKIDFSKLTTANKLYKDAAGTAYDYEIYRLFIYIRNVGNADPMYANDFVYKGRPFFIEFKKADLTDAAKIVAKANKWINLLFDNGKILNFSKDTSDEENGAVLKVDAIDCHQRFVKIELLGYNPIANDFAHDGDFELAASAESDSDKYVADFVTVTNGSEGAGTYEQMMKDLRLPTNANTRYYRHQNDEVPVVGGKYHQIVISQCTERPEMQGTSVLGQYNKSVTNHVLFVEDGVYAAFLADLKLGLPTIFAKTPSTKTVGSETVYTLYK